MKKIGKILILSLFLMGVFFQSATAKEVYEFIISVDTVMDHPRNQALKIFIKNLEEKSKGQFKVKFYHSASCIKMRILLKL